LESQTPYAIADVKSKLVNISVSSDLKFLPKFSRSVKKIREVSAAGARRLYRGSSRWMRSADRFGERARCSPVSRASYGVLLPVASLSSVIQTGREDACPSDWDASSGPSRRARWPISTHGVHR